MLIIMNLDCKIIKTPKTMGVFIEQKLRKLTSILTVVPDCSILVETLNPRVFNSSSTCVICSGCRASIEIEKLPVAYLLSRLPRFQIKIFLTIVLDLFYVFRIFLACSALKLFVIFISLIISSFHL